MRAASKISLFKLWSDILFMDVDAIPLGANFVRVLHDEVAKCEVLLGSLDEIGSMRVMNMETIVWRIQTISFESRLERRFNAISLWSQSWWMAPDFRMHANCPRNSKNFLFRNGIEVRLASFHEDVSRLINGLKTQLNIDLKRRREISSLAFFCAIGTGLLYIPSALFFFLVWHLAKIDPTSIVLSTILWMGFRAAAGVRSLRHGVLAAGAAASIIVFFLGAWTGPSLDNRSLAFIAWASALNAVWFGASFYGTTWIYSKLRKVPADFRWTVPTR